MDRITQFQHITVCTLWAVLLPAGFAQAQQSLPGTLPEQRSLMLRDPDSVAATAIPEVATPYTVSDYGPGLTPQFLTLDEAIRIALENANVVRFLGGVTASTSGRTVYDVAISNTSIDVQNAIFDPTFNITSTLNKSDRPGATFDPANPGQSLITGSSTDSVNTSVGLSQKMFNGANLGLNMTPVGSYFSPGIFPLDPQYNSGVEMTLRQPMMRGYGRAANMAPVVVARIDTERSYFQYKDSVQELVRGVINGYWNLVAARVEVWAREQQVAQAEFAYEQFKARQEFNLSNVADLAQRASALANFRANLITAKSNQILAETALRNLLWMPPSNTSELVPVSAPVRDLVDLDWAMLMALGERQRPDIVELKLVLEADQQLIVQANNLARPQFDGIANYRWDGLSGEMPNGANLQSAPGQFAGWNLGVNFSVPIGLRQSRAALRRQELVLARDQVNLEQGIHQMIHQLTVNYRNIAQFYAQIGAFGEARRAALLNYESQKARMDAGSLQFLNVLQAITDWGNAVSQEARSVTQYNSELANMERQTGTILETHGIVFYEERYSSLGPMGRIGPEQVYPSALRSVGGNESRYPDSGKPADQSFDLKDLSTKIREDVVDPPKTNDNPPDINQSRNGNPNSLRKDQPAAEPPPTEARAAGAFARIKQLIR